MAKSRIKQDRELVEESSVLGTKKLIQLSKNFSTIDPEDKNRMDVFTILDFDEATNHLSEEFSMSHAELDDMAATTTNINRQIDYLFTSMHTQCERFYQELEYHK